MHGNPGTEWSWAADPDFLALFSNTDASRHGGQGTVSLLGEGAHREGVCVLEGRSVMNKTSECYECQ